ncbi:MAG TPA: hypothetical protein ENG73_05505 [Desulfobacterales bacterium]|nr:hypothetical protein [Desulfobacterales bacterium]
MRSFITGIVLCLFLAVALLLSGCTTTSGGVAVGWGQKGSSPAESPPGRHHRHGPPPHAPAWGYRAKYQYWYYPDAFVYFDVTRKVYFYMEGPNWRMAFSLPIYYRTRLGGYVVIEMDSDTPYVEFHKHKKEYPPGHWKKFKKGKKKGKKW